MEIVALATLWMLFSGKFDAIHLGYGALSIALVVVLTRHLIYPRPGSDEDFFGRINWPLLLVYPFWLAWQVVLASLQVAAVILRPNMDLHPIVLRFHYPARCTVTRVSLGNSITLTPGTFTLRVEEGDFIVHALGRASTDSLMTGEMQSRVARAFGLEVPSPPRNPGRGAVPGVGRGLDPTRRYERSRRRTGVSLLEILSLVLAVALLLPFYRVLKGPTVYDRMLGVGTIGTKTVMLICMVGFLYGRIDMFIDIAIAYAMLNFIGAVAVAKYLEHTRGGAR